MDAAAHALITSPADGPPPDHSRRGVIGALVASTAAATAFLAGTGPSPADEVAAPPPRNTPDLSGLTINQLVALFEGYRSAAEALGSYLTQPRVDGSPVERMFDAEEVGFNRRAGAVIAELRQREPADRWKLIEKAGALTNWAFTTGAFVVSDPRLDALLEMVEGMFTDSDTLVARMQPAA